MKGPDFSKTLDKMSDTIKNWPLWKKQVMGIDTEVLPCYNKEDVVGEQQ